MREKQPTVGIAPCCASASVVKSPPLGRSALSQHHHTSRGSDPGQTGQSKAKPASDTRGCLTSFSCPSPNHTPMFDHGRPLFPTHSAAFRMVRRAGGDAKARSTGCVRALAVPWRRQVPWTLTVRTPHITSAGQRSERRPFDANGRSHPPSGSDEVTALGSVV